MSYLLGVCALTNEPVVRPGGTELLSQGFESLRAYWLSLERIVQPGPL